MAAGTGGHVIPGLAVASEMQARGWSVSWMGTPDGMEHRLLESTDIPIDSVAFAGLRGKGVVGAALGSVNLLVSLFQCWSIFRKRKVSAVLGMGGYVCVPGGLVAWLTRRPLVLVNADAAMLLSNKVLAPLADAVAFGFADSSQPPLAKAVLTGNPVRVEIETIDSPELRFKERHGPLKVLVVGGSSGAKALNDIVPLALAKIAPADRPLVIHQTGKDHIESVTNSYNALGVQATLIPFINDMPKHLSECDVIVCRAGAITISELCSAGVASILVPLVISTTSHQRDNAMWLTSHGAALHLPQTQLTAESLSKLLQSLTREELLRLASAAKNLARPAAASRVSDVIEKAAEQ